MGGALRQARAGEVPMSTHHDPTYECVEALLCRIAVNARSRLEPHGIIFNERYLHHEFSHRYQTLYTASNQLMPADEVMEEPTDQECALHPEWPTKKEVKVKERIDGGEYKGVSPVEAGSAGHIDFAVGPYRQPWLAIEFKLTLGWSGKAVGFDLVKLLDKRNRFERIVSFNFILRDRLSGSCKGLQDGIAKTYSDAVRRLGGLASPRGPQLWYLVAEIAPTERRFFQCRQTGALAVMGNLEVATVRGAIAPAWEALEWSRVGS